MSVGDRRARTEEAKSLAYARDMAALMQVAANQSGLEATFQGSSVGIEITVPAGTLSDAGARSVAWSSADALRRGRPEEPWHVNVLANGLCLVEADYHPVTRRISVR